MAYLKQNEDELLAQQQQLANAQTTTGSSSVVTGSQGAVDPNASAAQGTGWTSLSKYLDANQGLGAGVANAITKDSQAGIDSAAGKINEYQTKANASNEAGKKQTENLTSYQAQIASDPTKINANKYIADTSAGYQGATDAKKIGGYEDAWKGVANAKSSYDSLNSNDWNARSSAVASTFGKDNANYTKGSGLLDTFILQGDDAGQAGIKAYADKNAYMFADDNPLAKAQASVQSGLDADQSQWASLLGPTGTLSSALSQKKSAVSDSVDKSAKSRVELANITLKNQIENAKLLKDAAGLQGVDPSVVDTSADLYTQGDFVNDSDALTMEALRNLGAGEFDEGLTKKSGRDKEVSSSFDSGNYAFEVDPVSGKIVQTFVNAATGQKFVFDPKTGKVTPFYLPGISNGK